QNVCSLSNFKMADEDVFDVEKIIKKRINAEGETQYYVKWVGYKTPTWEPLINLAETSMLEEFEKNYVATPKRKGAATPKRKENLTPKKKEVSTPKKKEVSTPKKREVSTPKKKETSTPKEKSTPKSKVVLAVGKTPKMAARLQLTPDKSETSGISSTVKESARRGVKRTLEVPTPAKPVVVSYFEEQETPSTSRSVSPDRSSNDASVECNPAKRAKEGSPDIVKETKTEEVPKTCSIM
ncbi:hypothetical protein PENTCL1PPCAC_17419, partial [Pristionchus entomophagus]